MLDSPMQNYSNVTEDMEGDNSFTCYSTWGVIVATISLVSMVINILHLMILARMKVLNGRPYKLVLINITIADISTSFMLSLTYSCLPIIMSLTHHLRLLLPLVDWPFYASNWIFLVASVEQYYSVCQPFRYETSSFIKKLKLFLIVTWVCSFCTVAFTAATMHIATSGRVVFLALNLSSRYVPLFVAGIIFIILMRELKKLRERNVSQSQEGDCKVATYFLIIYSIFSAFSLVDVAMTCIAVFNHDILLSHSQSVRSISRPLYGIANTIIMDSGPVPTENTCLKCFVRGPDNLSAMGHN